MVNKENSLSMPAGTSIYRLEGMALRKWWQDPIITRNTDVYYNAGINLVLAGILIFPIYFLIVVTLNHQSVGLGSPKIVVPIVLWLFGEFLLLLSFFRRHRYHVLKVEASESGLEFRSPFLKRKIRWLDITDFFLAGTIDPKECVLQCKNGEEFFLAKDLTKSTNLFELINHRLAHPGASYELNYRLQDGYFDSCTAAASAMLYLGIFLVCMALVDPRNLAINNLGDLVGLIFLALIFTLSLSWCWLNLYKTPQLIRAGRLGLYLQTGSQSKVIPWDQITAIRQIPGLLIVSSRLGWFVMFASKNEPMTEKLLAYKTTVLQTSF